MDNLDTKSICGALFALFLFGFAVGLFTMAVIKDQQIQKFIEAQK